MADISKINAVALANIAKLDAVLAANIAKVNGLVFTAAAGEFLLDTYTGATAGYSVRRLATSATVLLRVRRDTAGGTGDDDEADVAYDSNNILSLDSAISNASAGVTATTLGQFLNVGTVNGTTYTNPDSLTVTASCFVDTWYDQAGSNDAEQATESAQPQIHDGTVNTDLITENGKPALDFNSDELQHQFSSTGGDQLWQENYSIFCAAAVDASGPLYGVKDVSSSSTRFSGYYQVGSTLAWFRNSPGFVQILSSSNLVAGHVLHTVTAAYTSNSDRDFTAYLDGTQIGTVNDTNTYDDNSGSSNLYNVLRVGAQFNQFLNGRMQELIMYASDQSSNRTDIETDINSDFLIYQPTDAPTSGLLATYTGAAAAYSVRQLSDKAVIALRIRRDSDDEETNIGWDSNGDLDTTAISDFCGTANGYVTRWWDQSTNGNHADQATDASQPQIYNGTAVITENGKPAVDLDGATHFLHINYTATFANISVWSVHAGTEGSVLSSYPGSTPKNFMETGMVSNQYRTAIRNAANTFKSISTGTTSDTQVLQHGHYDRSNVGVAIDGGTLVTTTATLGDIDTSSNGIDIGRTVSGVAYLNGALQEILLWNSDEAANRTGIETNINDYFSIY